MVFTGSGIIFFVCIRKGCLGKQTFMGVLNREDIFTTENVVLMELLGGCLGE